ncbi:hypothetical protein EDM55_09480 [Brevibacillus centrosporus]|nr:hypothetical protein EDM55_09480 [Brevibacillus centrosporus]
MSRDLFQGLFFCTVRFIRFLASISAAKAPPQSLAEPSFLICGAKKAVRADMIGERDTTDFLLSKGGHG